METNPADQCNPNNDDLSRTLRYMRCNRCGNVYVTSLSGNTECPECSSSEASNFKPDASDDGVFVDPSK
jgi:hypothetical protein